LDKKENATFVENLIAHIIKNVQVTIKDIHIRYEDQVTNPGAPFSIGLTLSQLKLQSTDESGKPTVAQQSISIFHKVMLNQIFYGFLSMPKFYFLFHDFYLKNHIGRTYL
jgi:vacuolar protein sorting-associated protein 13A/C